MKNYMKDSEKNQSWATFFQYLYTINLDWMGSGDFLDTLRRSPRSSKMTTLARLLPNLDDSEG